MFPTRLSLDAVRVLVSAFPFVSSLASEAVPLLLPADTRLSLDAVRVSGSVFYFACSLAFLAGIFFITSLYQTEFGHSSRFGLSFFIFTPSPAALAFPLITAGVHDIYIKYLP